MEMNFIYVPIPAHILNYFMVSALEGVNVKWLDRG